MKIANRRRADRAAAAQLDAYYDELASGVLAPRRDLVDPDIAAIASQIHHTGRRMAAPDNLKTQLWEDLMDSATLTSQHDATPPSRRTPSVPPNNGAAIYRSRERSTAWIPQRTHRRRSRLAFNAIATIALIAAIGFGAYAYNRPNHNGGSGAAQIAAPGTPASTVSTAPCLEFVGATFTYPRASLYASLSDLEPVFPSAAKLDHVQLQGWTIDGGASASLVSGQPSHFPGLAVDFILAGFYTATFDGPVYVVHSGVLAVGAPIVEPVSAGNPVSLAQGDAVAFNYGLPMSVHNADASKSTSLIFKRAVFTEQVAPNEIVTGSGFKAAINTSSVLPTSLGTVLEGGSGGMYLIPQVVELSDSTARTFCKQPNQIRALAFSEKPAWNPATPTAGGPVNGYELWLFSRQG